MPVIVSCASSETFRISFALLLFHYHPLLNWLFKKHTKKLVTTKNHNQAEHRLFCLTPSSKVRRDFTKQICIAMCASQIDKWDFDLIQSDFTNMRRSKLRIRERAEKGESGRMKIGEKLKLMQKRKKRWKSSCQNEMFIVQGIYVVVCGWKGWCIFVTCAIDYYKYIL